jgi:hypothetical protein
MLGVATVEGYSLATVCAYRYAHTLGNGSRGVEVSPDDLNHAYWCMGKMLYMHLAGLLGEAALRDDIRAAAKAAGYEDDARAELIVRSLVGIAFKLGVTLQATTYPHVDKDDLAVLTMIVLLRRGGLQAVLQLVMCLPLLVGGHSVDIGTCRGADRQNGHGARVLH